MTRVDIFLCLAILCLCVGLAFADRQLRELRREHKAAVDALNRILEFIDALDEDPDLDW